MKSLILSSVAVSTLLANAAFAQCSKSGGSHYNRPVYRPAPVLHQPVQHHHQDHTYTPVRKTCSIAPRPVHKPVYKPAPAPVELPKVESGQTVTIDGRLFGSRPGRVAVKIGALVMGARVVDWNSTQVTAVLPQLPLAAPAQATVVVLTISGNVADELDVRMLPASTPRPADPVAEQRPVVTAGQTITLEGANLGDAAGQVRISVSGLTLNAQVSSWSNTETTATLPMMSFSEPVSATVQILTASGQVADQIEVTFAPGPQQVAGR